MTLRLNVSAETKKYVHFFLACTPYVHAICLWCFWRLNVSEESRKQCPQYVYAVSKEPRYLWRVLKSLKWLVHRHYKHIACTIFYLSRVTLSRDMCTWLSVRSIVTNESRHVVSRYVHMSHVHRTHVVSWHVHVRLYLLHRDKRGMCTYRETMSVKESFQRHQDSWETLCRFVTRVYNESCHI